MLQILSVSSQTPFAPNTHSFLPLPLSPLPTESSGILLLAVANSSAHVQTKWPTPRPMTFLFSPVSSDQTALVRRNQTAALP